MSRGPQGSHHYVALKSNTGDKYSQFRASKLRANLYVIFSTIGTQHDERPSQGNSHRHLLQCRWDLRRLVLRKINFSALGFL